MNIHNAAQAKTITAQRFPMPPQPLPLNLRPFVAINTAIFIWRKFNKSDGVICAMPTFMMTMTVITILTPWKSAQRFWDFTMGKVQSCVTNIVVDLNWCERCNSFVNVFALLTAQNVCRFVFYLNCQAIVENCMCEHINNHPKGLDDLWLKSVLYTFSRWIFGVVWPLFRCHSLSFR